MCTCLPSHWLPNSYLYSGVKESFYDKSGREDLGPLLVVNCFQRRKVKVETKATIRALTEYIRSLNIEMNVWIRANKSSFSRYKRSCEDYTENPAFLHPPRLEKNAKIPISRITGLDQKLLKLFKKTIGAYGFYYTQRELSYKADADYPLQTITSFFRERPKHPQKKQRLIKPLEVSYKECQELFASVKEVEAHIQDIEYTNDEMWKLDQALEDFISKREKRKKAASNNQVKLIASLSSPETFLDTDSLHKLHDHMLRLSNELFFSTTYRLKNKVEEARLQIPRDGGIHDLFLTRASDYLEYAETEADSLAHNLNVFRDISGELLTLQVNPFTFLLSRKEVIKKNALLAITILDAISFLWENSGIRNGYILKDDVETTLETFSQTFAELKNFDEEISDISEKIKSYSLRLEVAIKELPRDKENESVNELIRVLNNHQAEITHCANVLTNSSTIYQACSKMLSFEYYHHFSRKDVKKFYNRLCSDSLSAEEIQTAIADLANYIKGSSKDWIITRPRSSSHNTNEESPHNEASFWSHFLSR